VECVRLKDIADFVNQSEDDLVNLRMQGTVTLVN
jgi:hypothetical protein